MEFVINELPVKTWNWLDVNEKKVNMSDAYDELEPLFIRANESETKTFNATFDFENEVSSECGIRKNIKLEVDNNASLMVVFEYKGCVFNAFEELRFSVSDSAKLTVVQIFDFDDKGEGICVSKIEGDVSKNGSFNLLQICKGGRDVSMGVNVNLLGDDSSASIDTGYLVSGANALDINYVIRHMGQRSDSKINVSGVLRDRAKKTFRGTIDFIRGSKNATGDEREDVLLMDRGVLNNTTPLILCGEENVEGAHGASIGKISDEAMYYFNTRGIREDEVNEIMANSRLNAVISRIPDAKVREKYMGNK
ncbi:SufD family Fe-S cluster assembly protein [uncultured Eubacterium sp.]|uniref:SufB/SufD family protein n=1 Tax=uncultured Eubacterium sp. TaxID=165185 RepID=UPI00259888BF|nr:SufD family Fe-S cluster assembly protein [uncultured Eubacterium sp.]